MSGMGYVRVVNYRRDMAPDSQPDEDEVVLHVDRRNPILGNRHILRNKLDAEERSLRINEFRDDLNKDVAINGPMSQAIDDIVERVFSGEKICLSCACRPLPCHADVIAEEVNRRVENRGNKTP